jgi:hypothetical protein
MLVYTELPKPRTSRCGYGGATISADYDWRCLKKATVAVTPDSFMEMARTMTVHERLHSRELCGTHKYMFTRRMR